MPVASASGACVTAPCSGASGACVTAINSLFTPTALSFRPQKSAKTRCL